MHFVAPVSLAKFPGEHCVHLAALVSGLTEPRGHGNSCLAGIVLEVALPSRDALRCSNLVGEFSRRAVRAPGSTGVRVDRTKKARQLLCLAGVALEVALVGEISRRAFRTQELRLSFFALVVTLICDIAR